MDKRREARELWEQSGGTLPLKEIAERLGVPLPTVKSWKHRDGWGQKDARLRKDATRQSETQRKRKAQVNRKAVEALEIVETLSDVEKDFCLHYVQCYNATQAAWRTGAYSTYGSAKQNGWRMLQKPAVQTEIKRLKHMKRAAILADADDLIELHMRIAFSDMKDYAVWAYDPERHTNRMAVLSSDSVDGQLVREVSESAQGFKIKLRDADESMRFLERFFEANPMDKHKKAYDQARLKLEQEKLKIGNEDALEKLDGILSGVDKVMQDED